MEHRSPRPAQLIAAAAGVGALTLVSLAVESPPSPWDVVLAVLGVAAALTQLWWPVTGALAATVLAVLSPVATPAATVGALQVAMRRRFGTAAAVAVAGVAAHLLPWLWRPNPALSFEWWAVVIVAVYGALLGWGTLARNHRELVISLRERARRVEAEQGRRIAEARAVERRSLARDMHDVLANRLSLVATHAGALEFRPDARPEQIARAAGVVRDSVHQALVELRQVIGLLREDDETGAHGPQPTLADLDRLIEETRQTDQQVRLSNELPDDAMPASVGRTAYRVLQEGLTNARKHATGRPIDVVLSGSPGQGLTVELSNPLSEPDTAPSVPGSGLGLVGLTERVRLAGGELDHGGIDGRFRLHARLPWPT